MMFKYFVVIMALSTMVGCATSYSESTQVSEESYLAIKGSLYGVILMIDDQSIDLYNDLNINSYYVDGVETVRFVVPRGKHHIKIYRHNKIIVNRHLFLSPEHTFEVKI